MTRDRAELQSWYLQAMLRRIDELCGLRSGLQARDPVACDAAREVGQALRGSGGTFGFPQLSVVAAVVETSTDEDMLRRVEGLVTELRELTSEESAPRQLGTEWLADAAGLDRGDDALNGITDASTAWSRVQRAAGIDASTLAGRVAEYFGLEVADLGARQRSALRLVPEALMASGRLVPVRDDSLSIIVATADPTSLATEIELERLTGRRPVFAVAPPEAIDAVLDSLHETPNVDRPAPAVAAPLVTAPSVAAPAPRRRRSPPRSPDEKQAVLIVDDDVSARVLLRAILEKKGHETVEAGDGEEALEVMRDQDSVGLIVADLNMPRMDGLELMWELRDVPEWGHLPVIVVTGEEDEILETQLMEEGADDYIRKPVDPRLFLARVEATIRRAAE